MKLTSVHYRDALGFYSEHVTIHVWMKNEGTLVNPSCCVHVFTPHVYLPHCSLPDLSKSPRIEILSPLREIIRPTLMEGKKRRKVVFAHFLKAAYLLNINASMQFTVGQQWRTMVSCVCRCLSFSVSLQRKTT